MRSNSFSGNKSKGPTTGAAAGVQSGLSEVGKFSADKEGQGMTSNQRSKAEAPLKAGK